MILGFHGEGRRGKRVLYIEILDKPETLRTFLSDLRLKRLHMAFNQEWKQRKSNTVIRCSGQLSQLHLLPLLQRLNIIIVKVRPTGAIQ